MEFWKTIEFAVKLLLYDGYFLKQDSLPLGWTLKGVEASSRKQTCKFVF